MLILLGVLWTVVGAWMLIRARRHRLRSISVRGEITKVARSRDPEEMSRLTFRFTTVDYRDIEVTSNTNAQRLPQRGDRVTVIYDPRKPQRASINTREQRGLSMGWQVTALGLFLLVLGVLVALNVL